jgi:hypothetical protein
VRLWQIATDSVNAIFAHAPVQFWNVLLPASPLLAVRLGDQTHRELMYYALQFHKRGHLFIRTHDETISVVAVRVHNPDRSPLGIHGQDPAQTPTGFAEIVCFLA